jgi:hypothetical protein
MATGTQIHGKVQFFDLNGNCLSGGKVYVYAAGTTTNKTSYTIPACTGGSENTQPVILDSRGEANIYVLGDCKIKVQDFTSADVYTLDNVQDINATITAKGVEILATLAASSGSSLVGYLPAGTGGVASTVQAQLRKAIMADGYATVAQADAIAFAAGADLIFPPGSYTTSASTISSNCRFSGGVLTPSVALTFTGLVTAPRYQIFGGSIGITLTGNDKIYPEWFGVIPNDGGTTNKEAQNKRMMNCVQASAGHLVFGDGTYYMRDLLVDGSNVEISGQGRSTILRNARTYWGSSTRFGNFMGVYSPNMDADPTGLLGNLTWTVTSQQKNVKLHDFDVYWDDGGVDLSMNGLAILGYDNVQATNVHINMHGANRAYYIGGGSIDMKTENITLQFCKSFECTTGAFVSEGLTPTNTGVVLRNITIENCVFNVTSALANSSGLYHHGSSSTGITAGRITFSNNVVYGGKCGVLTTAPGGTSRLQCFLTVENNYFSAFTEQGIHIYLKRARIANNTFDTTVLNFVALQLAAILMYSTASGGSQMYDIEGNTFKNLSGTGTVIGIHINCIAGSTHNIVGNRFVYENATAPQYDIFYSDAVGVAGDVMLSGNSFYSTGAANVRGTTTNDSYYYNDDGTNSNIYLYSEITKFVRSAAPTETTRRWRRGETVAYYLAGAGAGSQIGWVCVASGSPGTWRTFVG